MFTFLSVIRQNFEYNLRILANFRVKIQKSTDFAHTFSKNYSFFRFFNKDYPFYTKSLFFYNERCPKFCKNQFFSNMFTFLSVISQNFEYSLRILANFWVKTQISSDFARTFSKNYSFSFLDFLIQIILLTLKIYFLQRKMSKYLKNEYFSNVLTFLSVIRQKFEYNLRMLANFRVKTQKSMDFKRRFSKN